MFEAKKSGKNVASRLLNQFQLLCTI